MARVADEAPVGETIVGIVTDTGDGRRTFRRLVWGLAGLALLAVALVAMRPVLWPPTLAMRAEKLMSLPPGAKVTGVREDRWDREGAITFLMAEPKGPGSRLMEIWKLNGHMLPAPPVATSIAGVTVKVPAPPVPGWAQATTHQITITEPDYRGQNMGITLSYDPAKRVYIYERRHQEQPDQP